MYRQEQLAELQACPRSEQEGAVAGQQSLTLADEDIGAQKWDGPGTPRTIGGTLAVN